MRRFFYYNSGSVSVIPLLLDTYTAAAAYSLRKLRTAYAGSAIRVRRSSDNAEQDIGFSGDDLDTASLSSFVGASSAYVVTWYDQAGSNNVTQFTAANQPRIVNAGTLETKGGKPAVKFDGLNDRLFKNGTILNAVSTSYFSVSAATSTETVGIIHAQSATTTFRTIRTFCDSRTTENRNLTVNNTDGTSFAAVLSVARVDTNQRLLSSFIDASQNMSAFDNGATGGTNTYTGSTNNNLLQLGVQGTTTTGLDGYIQEFIGYNTDESANRTAIELNINSYYGIY